MIFKRKAYELLLEWKKGEGSSAVLIEGARRTGKSTLAEEFARNEYASYLLINFETAPAAVKSIFEDYRHDLDEFFKYLFAYYGIRLERRNALIIFDEVQQFPIARSFIKQLVADGRYDYMETGSLISIRKNVEGIIIPSEEDRIELWPLDFEEFLWARSDEQLAELIMDAFSNRKPLPEPLHRRASNLWREYLLLGGMPQSISAYINNKDFFTADVAKKRILKLYREDIMKFGGDDASKAAAIFNAIPGQLSKHEKKYTFSALDKNARYREYSGAFFWLDDAHMVNLCLNVTDPNIGLDLSSEDNNLKCYLCDTGLLCTMAFGDSRKTTNDLYQKILANRLNINEGMLVENIVAQQLVANGHRLRFYSKRDDANSKNTMEIDFLLVRKREGISYKERISPVEVKSTTRFSTRSLDKFKMKFGSRVGVEFVLSPRALKVEGNRVFLPLYMSHCL